jgi:hypothetical protein
MSKGIRLILPWDVYFYIPLLNASWSNVYKSGLWIKMHVQVIPGLPSDPRHSPEGVWQMYGVIYGDWFLLHQQGVRGIYGQSFVMNGL